MKKRTKNHRKNNRSETSTMAKYLRKAVFIALLFLVFYPPFFRGLYFEGEQLNTAIFVFIVFGAFCVYKWMEKDRLVLKTPIEYTAVGLLIVYFITILVAVNTHSAIVEWLKYCIYIAVFFMITDLVKTYKEKLTVIHVMIASALGVCFLGIDGMTGSYIAKGFNTVFEALRMELRFFDLFMNGRIYSTLQYANALGAYLLAMFFVVLGLIVISSKSVTRVIYAAIAFIILTSTVLTISRGVLLLMPFMAVLFVLILPSGNRMKGAYYGIGVLGSSLLAVLFLNFAVNTSYKVLFVWMIVFVGAGLSALIARFMPKAIEKLQKFHWKVYAVGAAGAIAVAVVVSIILLNASTVLTLENTQNKDIPVGIKKDVILEPGREYKAVFDVEAFMEKKQPYAYRIRIASKSRSDIISDTQTNIAKVEGGATQGIEQKEIKFMVAEDSALVSMYISNTYSGTGAKFHRAKIIDVQSGEMVKNVTLKYKYIPDSIASRIEGIGTSKSWMERITFYKDGLKIIKDYWFLGAGGGAWASLYLNYQSFGYASTQIHSYFVQTAIESGILGLLIVLLFVLSIILLFLSEYRAKGQKDIQQRVMQGAIFVSIITLFAHSAIDFDLSLGAVSLLLWELVALYNIKYREADDEEEVEGKSSLVNKIAAFAYRQRNQRSARIPPVAGAILAGVLLIPPVSFTAARAYGNEGAWAIEAKDYAEASKHMKKAAALDPFTPGYKMDYAVSLLKSAPKGKPSQEDVREALEEMEKATGLSKHNGQLTGAIASFYVSIGDIQKGLEMYDKQAKLWPMKQEAWLSKMGGYSQVVFKYFDQNKNDKALEMIEKAMGIINEAEEINKESLAPFIFNAGTMEKLEMLRYVQDNAGESDEIDAGNIIFYSMPNLDIDHDNVPDQWKPVDPLQAEVSKKEGVVVAESIAEGRLAYIQSRELTFVPGTTCRIEVKLKDANVPSIPFIVNYINSDYGELKPSGDVYTAEIQIPKDYKPKNNFLILGVKDKYEIKDIKIEIK